MANYIGESILGLGILVALAWGWHQLGQSRLGSAIQGLVVTLGYLAWLALPIFGLYNIVVITRAGFSEGNAGGAIFVALYGTPCMLLLLAFPLGIFNYFLKYLNEKWCTTFKFVPFLATPSRW